MDIMCSGVVNDDQIDFINRNISCLAPDTEHEDLCGDFERI